MVVDENPFLHLHKREKKKNCSMHGTKDIHHPTYQPGKIRESRLNSLRSLQTQVVSFYFLYFYLVNSVLLRLLHSIVMSVYYLPGTGQSTYHRAVGIKGTGYRKYSNVPVFDITTFFYKICYNKFSAESNTVS